MNWSGSDSRSPRVTIIISIAVIAVCVISGPFHTAALPWPTRTLFWVTMIGWNVTKWQLWGRLAPQRLPAGAMGAALGVIGGAILLNLTLPLEINWLFAAVGVPVRVSWPAVFLAAAAISLLIGAIVALISIPAPVTHGTAPDVSPASSEASAAAAAPIAAMPTGLAARVDFADLHAIVAEDHYLRLHLADGRQPLVLYRFGDALQELAALPGLQVHRSAWVADAARPRAIRDGRKWRLQLASGVVVPVSQTFVPALRARGVLQRAV